MQPTPILVVNAPQSAHPRRMRRAQAASAGRRFAIAGTNERPCRTRAVAHRAPAARRRAIANGEQPLSAHLWVACLSAKSSLEMNSRHAAALALVGWYLMVSPLSYAW